MRRLLTLLTVAILAATLAPAHYQFVHFNSRTAPFRPVPEKFDVNVLPNRTLSYFIADPSNVQLAPNDSAPSLISQIRAAATVWSDVELSELRLAFGGIVSQPTTSQSTPSLDVVFDEVPPGVRAYGGPTVRADSNGAFVPILKSVVVLPLDLKSRPSHTEEEFLTMVHEMGHALGLQHTLTSSVMSTSITRSTSKGRPLTADDVAGISYLYPRPGFTQSSGTIAGRVTMSGSGVNLASVVAVAPNGAAVSALSNPDGTYRIEGIQPRSYFVYVHPLPPAQNGEATPAAITYPTDADGRPLGVGSPFETQFFPGTRDPQAASLVEVRAGGVTENINFTVRQAQRHGIHSVRTYSFTAGNAIRSPYLNPGSTPAFIVATGTNLIGQNVEASILGGGTMTVTPYAQAPTTYLQLDLDRRTLLVPSDSAKHVVFSTPSDVYVLPAAFFHVERQPPAIASVTPGPERTITLQGPNLNSNTRIFFDGVQGQVREADDAAGRLVVVAPPAGPGQRAVISAFNIDGQSSLFLQSSNPPTYVYPSDGAGAPVSLSVSPASLAPGTEAMVQVDGLNTNFVDGQVKLGFGSSDVVVRGLWVVSSTRVLANVAVSPNAAPGALNVTVASGLQTVVQPAAVQAQAAPRAFWLSASVTNAATGQPAVSPGSAAILTVGAAPVNITSQNTAVLLNDARVPVTSVSGNLILIQLPANLQPGPVVVRLEAGGERSSAIVLQIETLPRILTANRNAELMLLSVINGGTEGVDQMTVAFGGKAGKVLQAVQQGDTRLILVQIPADAPNGDAVPLQLTIGSRAAEPFSVTIGK